MVRGESKKLTVFVRNKITGALVDCSAATGILFGLYQEGGIILEKWSKVLKTGFNNTINETDAATGTFVIYISVDKLQKGIQNKMVKFEGKILFPNGAYPGGIKVDCDTNITVEELESSIFEGVSPV